MPDLLLYSTNTYLKYLIHQKYASDTHYVWCSAVFDTRYASPLTTLSRVPPSSNPIEIYRDLHESVTRGDNHSAKVVEQRMSLRRRALAWHKAGSITDSEKQEIIWLAKNSPLIDFRPLIYVIPWQPIVTRAQLVPPNKRAGLGPEYIISDLTGDEFHIIEPYK